MTTTTAITRAALSKKNKVGLIIASLLALTDVGSIFNPTPDGEEGPPYAVLVVGGVCGVITLIAAFIAWRTAQRAALRVAAGSRILSAILALPAFFVDIPAALQAATAVFVVVTVVCVVLMLTPDRGSQIVTD
jgi:hypothetical protein